MKISVWNRSLSDSYLRLVVQLGANCIDFASEYDFPGVRENGRPDLSGVLDIKKRLSAWGLGFNRVTLPEIPAEYMSAESDEAVERSCAALRVFAEAGVPIASQRFAGAAYRDMTTRWQSAHRGGYLSRAESLDGGDTTAKPSAETRTLWWERFISVYSRLAPVAEEYGIRITAHPSDSPVPDAPISGQGLHRLFDAFPGPRVGCIYCCGTRSEAGGSSLVLDEINAFGRKGKIFMVHFRNVRGSFATSGGFEEVLLDDGDMNMFSILRGLDAVGFDGCLNPDHYPKLEGDKDDINQALSYSVGYIKALLLALRS
jgi:mannonate dehydratase